MLNERGALIPKNGFAGRKVNDGDIRRLTELLGKLTSRLDSLEEYTRARTDALNSMLSEYRELMLEGAKDAHALKTQVDNMEAKPKRGRPRKKPKVKTDELYDPMGEPFPKETFPGQQ